VPLFDDSLYFDYDACEDDVANGKFEVGSQSPEWE